MKGMWKKSIGLMLSLVMLLSLCSPLALAAESENVFFEADMESYDEGAAPPKGEQGFELNAITDVARLYVEKDETGNKVLKGYHGDPTAVDAKARAPRAEKIV
ncbi:MAG: hypothetical protein IJD83_09505, partial [Clostridia bacterium]|nr:hypothetical protein [Clostridia bacterium]